MAVAVPGNASERALHASPDGDRADEATVPAVARPARVPDPQHSHRRGVGDARDGCARAG